MVETDTRSDHVIAEVHLTHEVQERYMVVTKSRKGQHGVAWYNATSAELRCATMEGESHMFAASLEKLLLIVGPEVIFCDTNAYRDDIVDVLLEWKEGKEGNRRVSVERESPSYHRAVAQLLKVQLPRDGLTNTVEDRWNMLRGFIHVDREEVVESLGALLEFLGREGILGLSEGWYKLTLLQEVALEGQLRIDKDSLRALNIYSDSAATGKTVFSICLDHCVSAAGKRLLRSWFLHPTTNPEVISFRQDAIDLFKGHGDIIMEMKKVLKTIEDPLVTIQRCLKQQSLPLNTVRDFVRLQKNFRGIISLRSHLESCFKRRRMSQRKLVLDETAFLEQILPEETIKAIQQATYLLEELLDVEQLPDGMCIHYGVSKDLDDLKTLHYGLPDLMSRVSMFEKSRVPKSFLMDIVSWEVVSLPHSGFFLHSRDGLIPSHILDFLEDAVLQFEPGTIGVTYMGALYTTQATLELSRRFGGIMEKISDLETAICNAIARKIAEYAPLIKDCVYVASQLDCIMSLSELAHDLHLVRPRISSNDSLTIKDGWNIVIQQDKVCIPNETCFGVEKGRIHVITGTNASGKTSYLQQVATIAYLCHIGSFVPAQEASIPLMDGIFTRMLNYEDLSSSHFCKDLLQLARMINSLTTEKCLIIIDEFGKGTLGTDRAGLTAGTIEHFQCIQKTPYVMIATQMGSIIDETVACTPKVSWYHMGTTMPTQDNTVPVPLYQVRQGNSSFHMTGIAMATQYGIPSTISDRAQLIVDLTKQTGQLQRRRDYQSTVFLQVFNMLKNLDVCSDDSIHNLLHTVT